MSENESSAVESLVDVSEFETQFIPKSNDEEELWKVIEITAERKKQYKVKWAGFDPATKKPWPQSWVDKHDVTNDLALIWKKKKREEAKKKARKGVTQKSRASAVSAISIAAPISNGSVASSSSTVRRERSSATASLEEPIPKKRRGSTLNPSTPHAKRKRSPSPGTGRVSSPESSSIVVLNQLSKKKRKVDVEVIELPLKSRPPIVQSRGATKGKVGEVELGDSMDRELLPRQKAHSKERTEVDSHFKVESNDETGNHITRTRHPSRKRRGNVASRQSTITSSTSNPNLTPKSGTMKTAAPRIFMKTSPSSSRKGSVQMRSSVAPSEGDNASNYVPQSTSSKSLDDEQNAKPKRRRRQHHTTDDEQGQTSDGNLAYVPLLSPADKLRLLQFEDEVELMITNPVTSDHIAGSPNDRDLKLPEVAGTSDAAPQGLTDDVGNNPTEGSPQPIAKLPLFLPTTPEDHISHPVYEVGRFPDESRPSGSSINDNSPTRGSKSQPRNHSVVPPQIASLDDSFKTGVVPETETDSSTNNTQSQSQSLPESHPQALHQTEIASSPTRGPSLVSKMKPRSPNSPSKMAGLGFSDTFNDLSHDPNHKSKRALGPVPVITPSKFRDHLPSSIPYSTIESVGLEEPEFSMSSIEDFSSPEKGQAGRMRRKAQGTKRKVLNRGESDEDEEEAIRTRGQQLAHAAKVQRERDRGEEKVTKKTLSGLRKVRKRKGENSEPVFSFSSDHDAEANNDELPTFRDALISDDNASTEDIAVDDHLNDAILVQELENQYVDLEGGIPADQGITVSGAEQEPDPHIALRQEEEESTQDMLTDNPNNLEVEPGLGANDADASGLPEVSSDSMRAVRGTQAEAEALALKPELEDHPHAHDEPDIDRNAISSPAAEIRPKSRSKSAPIQKNPDIVQELPPTASTRHNSPELDVTSRSQTHPPTATRTLGAAMTLLNTKSEEISRLERLLSLEQASKADLLKQLDNTKDDLALAKQAPLSEIAELNQMLSEARMSSTKKEAEWEEHRAAWDAERAALIESINALKNSQASAESDRDFFRKQYAEASSFVSSIRKENLDLEEQAKIATSQASDGVAIVRRTFEVRNKLLESEIFKWKRLANMVVEKDKRTNDDIRRRAAEEPELRAQCLRLRVELHYAQNEVMDLQEQIHKLTSNIATLEEEKTALLSMSQTSRKQSNGAIAKSKVAEDDSEDMVYRCQWRPNGGNVSCDALFVTVEELEEHLFDAAHLFR